MEYKCYVCGKEIYYIHLEKKCYHCGAYFCFNCYQNLKDEMFTYTDCHIFDSPLRIRSSDLVTTFFKKCSNCGETLSSSEFSRISLP